MQKTNFLKRRTDTSEELSQKFIENSEENINRLSLNKLKALTPVPTLTSYLSINRRKEINFVIQKLEQQDSEKPEIFKKNSKKLENNVGELKFKKIKLEQQIANLLKENLSLKGNQNIENIESQKNENLKSEMLLLKNLVSELESKHEENQKTIKINEEILEKISKIPKNSEKSFEKPSKNEKSFEKPSKNEKSSKNSEKSSKNSEKKVSADNLHKKLLKKLNSLQNNFKANESKYKQKLKEYESIEKELSQSRVCLQMKLLKAKQQERLLEIAVNQSKISEKGESTYTNPNFLYKPSIKGLYL